MLARLQSFSQVWKVSPASHLLLPQRLITHIELSQIPDTHCKLLVHEAPIANNVGLLPPPPPPPLGPAAGMLTVNVLEEVTLALLSNWSYSKIFWSIVIIFLLALCVLSVIQVGFMTKGVYSIRDHQNKISELSKENRLLAINFSKSNSLAYFKGLISDLNLERSDKVEYIQILGGQAIAR